MAQAGTGAVQRKLLGLAEAGLVTVSKQTYYQREE